MEAGHRGALADLPEPYGPWQTCDERFRRWQADGTWQRLLTYAQTRSDTVGEVDWDVVAVGDSLARRSSISVSGAVARRNWRTWRERW